MSRPNALIQLLDNLRAENIGTTVVTIRKSSATIYLENAQEIVLTPEECELLFDTQDTIRQLADAIGSADCATVELNNVTVDDEVMDTLKEYFSSVEES